MSFQVHLIYKTWKYEQNQNLFDYHEENLRQQILKIQKSGIIYRHEENFSLFFMDQGKQLEKKEKLKYEKLLYVYFSERNIRIKDIHTQKQPLQIIVPQFAEQNASKGCQLVQGSVIKIGKAKLTVQRINTQKKFPKTHYQLFQIEGVKKIQKITSQFYSYSAEDEGSKFSIVEENPACRYCFSKTIKENNSFRILCSCEGSAKYIHENCLIQWINMRTKIVSNEDKSIYVAATKGFECQICKSKFPIDIILHILSKKKENLHFQAINELKEYFILSGEKEGENILYIIDLAKRKQIRIGRNISQDIALPDLSVSRLHCQLNINEKKQIFVFDQNSKFGTTVKETGIKLTEKTQKVQKGRTLMKVRRVEKKSFFYSLFCSAKEQFQQEQE